MRLRLDETHVMERLDTPSHRAAVDYVVQTHYTPALEPVWLRHLNNRTAHQLISARWTVGVRCVALYPLPAPIHVDNKLRAKEMNARSLVIQYRAMRALFQEDVERWLAGRVPEQPVVATPFVKVA